MTDRAGESAAPPPPRYDRSIVEGPLAGAVWRLAWPTMLVNIIGGMQSLVDQVLVGHIVGFTGNAAIGVSNQVFIAVFIFITSVFIGMSVLVSRFVGAGDADKVNRTVYQACITAVGIAVLVMAPAGYFLAPSLLDFVNAAPAVQVQALPFLRIMFMTSSGMLVYFMVAGALRSAGDARTPMILGFVMTGLNIVLNVVLIRGLGPIPSYGTTGAAMGTAIASGLVATYAIVKLWRGGWVVRFPRGHGFGPDWAIIRELFRFGLPAGFQGIAMNIGGVFLLAFVGSLAQSAPAQAAYAVSYNQLFSFVTWTSIGLMGAAAAMAGQNLGAGRPDRTAAAVHIAARIGVAGAACVGLLFFLIPRQLLAIFGIQDPAVVPIGAELLGVLSVSGLFVAAALTYTGGLQGTGDTRSPLFITLIAQIAIPLGLCFYLQATDQLQASGIWLAIVLGHFTRCVLTMARFYQGRWKTIAIDLGH
jgi:putative MATE family efflux protein